MGIGGAESLPPETFEVNAGIHRCQFIPPMQELQHKMTTSPCPSGKVFDQGHCPIVPDGGLDTAILGNILYDFERLYSVATRQEGFPWPRLVRDWKRKGHRYARQGQQSDHPKRTCSVHGNSSAESSMEVSVIIRNSGAMQGAMHLVVSSHCVLHLVHMNPCSLPTRWIPGFRPFFLDIFGQISSFLDVAVITVVG